MKIKIEEYDPDWKNQFNQIQQELSAILKELNPIIEHFGSTSVIDLAAKPVIDVLVGIRNGEDLDKTIRPMLAAHYIYYEAFNADMPQRRLFVGLKNKQDITYFKSIYKADDALPHEEINNLRLSHIHIWKYGSSEWIRHIAFREYLRNYPEVKREYEMIKKDLSLKTWKNGMEYNEGKNDFIKSTEKLAINWYKKHK